MTKKVAVIDGNSLMHRAFHAVPPTMNAPDGTPTNAVFGFLSMLLKFIDVAQPDAIVCAFDAGRPKWRMEAIEQYKAQRPPMDESLKVQFPLIEGILKSMSIPVVKLKGWEGDDILGTVAARDEELGYQTLLVTGDKDAYQLASELTHIVTTKKGISDVAIYGPSEVEERYGVTPDQFPDFLGLMGDSSDNIPGVPGIGPKNATKLLQAYGSMEGIYDHLGDLKGKQLENLQNNKDLAFASRKVATIARNVDFELDLEEAAFPRFDTEEVTKAFRKLRLNTQLSRVLALVGVKPVKEKAELVWEPLLEGDDAQAAFGEALKAGACLGVAVKEPEQFSLFNPSVMIAFNLPGGTALFEDEEAYEALARAFREGEVATLNIKELMHYVYPISKTEAARVTDRELLAAQVFDIALAGYVLNSSVTEYSYDALLDAYCGGVLPEGKHDKERVAIQAAAARLLKDPLIKALEEDESKATYFDIDLPLVSVLTVMERTGAAIDTKRLAELGVSTAAELETIRNEAYAIAGEEFNLDSPKQLAHVLFEVLKLPPLKKNQRGYSTDAGVLKELAKQHDFPALILRYRELAKIKSTYIDALSRLRAEDGQVHTTFNETVTTTGRLSSSDPNLQNIPVRTDFGRQIRECFVPLEEGHKFLSADYSQIELRLLAHLSQDESLIQAFCSGEDFHASTAARVFGVPMSEVTPQMRSRAKAVNFGIVYGQQAFGLAASLDIPFGEAKQMIDRYFEVHPGVRQYLDTTVAEAKETGYAVTMFGRKRHIPELHAANQQQRGFGERTAMNHPMQGSAADIIKLAMRQVQERLLREGFKAKLLLQVHDELDFSVPEEEVERLSVMVKEVMEQVVALRVPLVVDVSFGDNWAEAH